MLSFDKVGLFFNDRYAAYILETDMSYYGLTQFFSYGSVVFVRTLSESIRDIVESTHLRLGYPTTRARMHYDNIKYEAYVVKNTILLQAILEDVGTSLQHVEFFSGSNIEMMGPSKTGQTYYNAGKRVYPRLPNIKESEKPRNIAGKNVFAFPQQSWHKVLHIK